MHFHERVIEYYTFAVDIWQRRLYHLHFVTTILVGVLPSESTIEQGANPIRTSGQQLLHFCLHWYSQQQLIRSMTITYVFPTVYNAIQIHTWANHRSSFSVPSSTRRAQQSSTDKTTCILPTGRTICVVYVVSSSSKRLFSSHLLLHSGVFYLPTTYCTVLRTRA